MLLQQTPNREHFVKTDNMIEHWLTDRQKLLIDYNNLCHWFKENNTVERKKILDSFCQRMVDYIAFGHFAVFEKIVESNSIAPSNTIKDNAQQDDSVPTPVEPESMHEKLLEYIGQTTEVVLNFNDKFQENAQYPTLKQDISDLGEQLAHRFEWEDELVQVYLAISKKNEQQQSQLQAQTQSSSQPSVQTRTRRTRKPTERHTASKAARLSKNPLASKGSPKHNKKGNLSRGSF